MAECGSSPQPPLAPEHPSSAADAREHKHRHHHKHKQHRHAHKPSSSRSYEDLTAVISSNGSSGALAALAITSKRPKSFTHGQAAHRHHHQHSRTAGAQPAQLHRQQQNGSQLGQQHGSVLLPGHAPRRPSPLRQAEPHVVYARAHQHGARQPPGSSGSSGNGGSSGSGGISGSGSSMTGSSGLGQQPQRLLAEFVKVQQVAKGFASSWLSNRVINVFDGSGCVAPATELLRGLPCTPCLHIWLVRAPRSRQWVPVHLGGAENLRQGLAAYLHNDGSCGPLAEPSKRRVLLDLMCRGFAVQVRFRPLKTGCASIQDDQLTKLAAFDFPLNDANNGGCRPIELERPVAEYPVVVAAMEQLYSRLYGPRRRL